MMIKNQMCVLTTFKDEIYKRLNAFQSGPLPSKEAVNLYSPLSDLGFHSIPWRCENSEVVRSTSRPQSRTKQTVMMSRQLQGLSGGRQLWCFLQSVSDRLPLVAIWLYAYLKKNNVAGHLCCFAVSSTTTPISVENVWICFRSLRFQLDSECKEDQVSLNIRNDFLWMQTTTDFTFLMISTTILSPITWNLNQTANWLQRVRVLMLFYLHLVAPKLLSTSLKQPFPRQLW